MSRILDLSPLIRRKRLLMVTIVMIMQAVASPFALAAEGAAQAIDKADTAWVLVSTAMVMFMTPGLAIFYAGMARKKNALSIMMQSFFILCLISLQWVLWGYTLSFGNDISGLLGGFQFLGADNVGVEAKGIIPHLVFMMFQGMFAAITVALITGAFAERIKFSAVIVFSILWATFIYDPLCHWVWGGGWMQKLGVVDFAGGIVVHISSGLSALVAALYIGKRKGYPRELMAPHNLTLTVMGMGILWFGWFGFNAGSALASDGGAAIAFVTTNTPAAGFVTPGSSIIIGVMGGILCYVAVSMIKPRLQYDDTLDVFGIHGVAGTWGTLGTLATGIFATIGVKGLIAGNPEQLAKQAIGAVTTIVLAVIGTYIILRIVDAVIGLRVSAEQEIEGRERIHALALGC